MKKIAVAGAGVGGVVCAYYLAKEGFDVTVYERASYDNVTYDWHDDIAKDTFDKVGLPFPPQEIYFDKRNWTFIAPDSDRHVYADLPQPTDISIARRPFLHWLMDMAKGEGVHFEFETEVGLWLQGKTVCGITKGDEQIEYALVVDCTGLYSPLRKALPTEAGIQFEIDTDDVFCAYRGFYRRNKHVKVEPNETNRVYLLHQGGRGISWCLSDPTQRASDVLIGRVGALSEDCKDQLFAALQAQNPILSDQLLSGGRICRIPIRRPLSRLVWDGYAVLGDAACMTIPMIGSGMAASMLAGKLLAETVSERQSVSKEALWHYQVAFYQQCGAELFGVDVLKRWMLQARPEDVKWLFESGVLDKDNINDAASGKNVRLTVGQMLGKLGKGFSRIGLLLQMAKVLQTCQKAVKRAQRIPPIYNEEKITAWQENLEKLFAD